MGEINPKIDDSWKSALSKEFENEYFSELKNFLIQEKQAHIVYPPGGVIFEALNRTPLQRVKVVILGQDPYHGPGQAHGLCFSVPEGVAFPPSLQNIFRELQTDLGTDYPLKGDLSAWADQGVLLLNATLTVRANLAGSHQGRGWENFTDAVIRTISDLRENVVFLLWGKYAQNKKSMIDIGKHFVLEAPHPSPLSAYRGFFGCRHFSITNEFLISKGLQPINWAL